MSHVIRKTTRPLRRLSDYVNKLPLAGKLFIRPIMFLACAGPPNQRIARASLALLLLAIMIYAHYSQMTMGWETYTRSSFIFTQTIGLAYATVNALVVYTHCVLSLRLIRMAWKSSKYRKSKNYRLRLTPLTPMHTFLCFTITLGGQAVFLVSRY